MKFYGWRKGSWRGEDDGPPSRYSKQKSAGRQGDRRDAKKSVRQRFKKDLRKVSLLG